MKNFESNSLLSVNATKMYQFNENHSELKYPLCLENNSKYYTAGNIKKTRIKLIFWLWYYLLILQMLLILIDIHELSTGIVSASTHAKCVLLSNQKCMIQPTLINLHPNEYS